MSFVSTYSAASIRAWAANQFQWRFYSTLSKPYANAGLQFGWSTAIDNAGEYVVVGTNASSPANIGTVSIFTGSLYSSRTDLIPSIGNTQTFGRSVTINGYGNTVAATQGTGNVFIFDRSGNTWNQIQLINIGVTLVTGTGINLNETGNYLVAQQLVGNTFIYSRTGNTYSLQQTINANISGSGPGAKFDANANRLIISDVGYPGTGIGRVYVYTRSGNTWSLEQSLNPTPNSTGQLFGSATAINADGTKILVGALTFGSPTASGRVYSFSRTGNTWSQTQVLSASDIQAQSAFGSSISIDNTGTQAVIGAYGFDGSGNISNNQGKAYFFSSSNNTWTETQSVQAPVITGSALFGYAVALSGNNNVCTIGSPGFDSPNTDNGAAYVYVNA